MGDQNTSCGGTQIDDLPSCLIIDILSRLPIKTSTASRLVCKSWFILFSDPLFVRLQLSRSPTCILRRKEGPRRKKRPRKNLKFRLQVEEGCDFEDCEFEVSVSLPDSISTCANSCRGLLCFQNCVSCDEIYVCNPVLGEYITIPIVNRESMSRVKSVLGFSPRSNQYKVLQIHSLRKNPAAYMAEIYTIGNGTEQWKSIGIAPSCIFDFPDDSVNSFLNGSIHWADGQNHQIVYFDFESEQFGWLPSPPAWRHDGRWSKFWKVKLGVLDGCLCIHACGSYRLIPAIMEKWVMTEYGVEESWMDIFSPPRNIKDLRSFINLIATTTYSPSFVSLQDVARSENVKTVLSRTRAKDQDSLEGISNTISQLASENAYEEAAGE